MLKSLNMGQQSDQRWPRTFTRLVVIELPLKNLLGLPPIEISILALRTPPMKRSIGRKSLPHENR